MRGVPSHLLDQRARTDAGRFDEMGEGVLHMVPPPDEEHQRIEWELSVVLGGPAGVGVVEVVVVDQDSKAVRHWARAPGGPLDEQPAGAASSTTGSRSPHRPGSL